MSVFKSVLDRMREKKAELEKRALKAAARGALEGAGKVVDAASSVVERAIFGAMKKDEDGDAPDSEETKEQADAKAPAPDPFARVKALEKEREEREREAKRRQKEAERREKEVDDELAAMKKRLGK